MGNKEDNTRGHFSHCSRRTFLGHAGSIAAFSAAAPSLEALSVQPEQAGSEQPCTQCGAVMFYEEFAPSESFIHPVEHTYRESICLNGVWQFQPCDLPSGFQGGKDPAPALSAVDPTRWQSAPVYVPSPWNVNSFAYHDGLGGDYRCYPGYPESWGKVEMAWLRKRFTVPSHWKGKHLSLHFEAVAGKTEVLVNGKKAGEHFDIFLPFETDVTSLVKYGEENEVLVGVRKASLFNQQGPYGRRPYQGGSFWGQHIAGIWQDVNIVAVSPIYISDVYLQPKVDEDVLEAQVTCQNNLDHEVEIGVSANVFPLRSRGKQHESQPYLPHNELELKATLAIPSSRMVIPARSSVTVTLRKIVQQRLQQWDGGHPHLYGFVAEVQLDRKIVDAKYTRFGWRQISFRGSEVCMNGKPLVLRGDSWHFMGIPQMTRRYAWAWFTALKKNGLNAVRLHAQPYPSFYLDVADEMGIHVLDETAIWASDGGPKVDDPAFWKDTNRHLAALILRDRNHPSVFGWSTSNEMLPVITNVMRNPPGPKAELLRHYTIWASICRRLDPSRPWISADGDEDGEGRLPVYIVHYGGSEAMQRGEQSGKPWGVGEAGDAYYATPPQVAKTNGERAYESFEGRMEGVAISSYQSLVEQRAHGAIYRSVFNLVWYGLKPLPLGMRDLAHPPSLQDGIFFPAPIEGKPGVRPTRLGPYCTTLNPGYDANLPLYQEWPLCGAIRDASQEPPLKGKWSHPPSPSPPQPLPQISQVSAVGISSGKGSSLFAQLQRIGVPQELVTSQDLSQILFVDGNCPPSGNAHKLIRGVLRQGGTVFVWGVNAQSLAALNALLPAPVKLTRRDASSLLPQEQSVITDGLRPDNLYFCDESPPDVVHQGLGGTLISQSCILLSDCNTNWLAWNNQPEYAKTAMILRSERQAKPSGVVLAEKKMGEGRLLITVLSSHPRTVREENVSRTILSNLGIQLNAGLDVGKPLLRSGILVRALVCGYFAANDASVESKMVSASVDQLRKGETIAGRKWRVISDLDGRIDIGRMHLSGYPQNGVAYLSFWVQSPRSLEDLLLQPNLPRVALEANLQGAVIVWLNGQTVLHEKNSSAKTFTADALGLRRGWNHFLVAIQSNHGKQPFQAHVTSNQPEFLSELDSALEKP